MNNVYNPQGSWLHFSRRKTIQIVFAKKTKSYCLLCFLQLQSLLPLQQVPPAENILEEYGLKDADLPKQLFS